MTRIEILEKLGVCSGLSSQLEVAGSSYGKLNICSGMAGTPSCACDHPVGHRKYKLHCGLSTLCGDLGTRSEGFPRATALRLTEHVAGQPMSLLPCRLAGFPGTLERTFGLYMFITMDLSTYLSVGDILCLFMVIWTLTLLFVCSDLCGSLHSLILACVCVCVH